MISRAVAQASMASRVAARRGFHTTRVQFNSPYHYPEGPRTNIPFNPLTRFFYLRYIAFCGTVGLIKPLERSSTDSATATGFGLPFAIAC